MTSFVPNSDNHPSTRSPLADIQKPRFAAVIRPHRSLSPDGFLFLMFAVAAIALGSGLLFASLGAWPVLGFMGLDVLLIFWAFKANFLSGRQTEEFILTDTSLEVRVVTPEGRKTVKTFHPHWIKLVAVGAEDIGLVRLAIRSHGQDFDIGAFLSPQEREDLAVKLGSALETIKVSK